MRCITFAFSLFTLALAAGADTLLISSGGGNPVSYANVKVLGIERDQVVFQTPTGMRATRPLGQVTRMMLDDEPGLSIAEEAYAAGKWDFATDEYLKALRSAKPLVAGRSALRLLDSANKAGRFDAAVTAYAAVAISNPAYAIANKPPLPDAQSTYLDSAVGELEQALATPNLHDEQKQALLSLELDIYRARRNSARAMGVIERLTALKSAGEAGPAGTRLVADLKLGMAMTALYKKDYGKALAEIESGRTLFTEPSQQAEALFCIAEARHGLAEQTKEEWALKDAALAYMRVVAHFQDTPGAPHVAESLFQCAGIMQQLDDRQSAIGLYQQVMARYPAGPLAAAARLKLSQIPPPSTRVGN